MSALRERGTPPKLLDYTEMRHVQKTADLFFDTQIILTAAEEVAERISHQTNSSSNSTIKTIGYIVRTPPLPPHHPPIPPFPF